MPPNDESEQQATETVIPNDEWSGPWGAIEPVPHSVETLCVQLEHEPGKPRIYYYPYRTIGKWNWTMGVPETLEIQIGGVKVSVGGTGLRRLAEALNMGQLRLVQLNKPANLDGQICIQSIQLEDLKA
jgi:hypothetical protein